MALRCALAGNPNSGKTTLFNHLTGSSAHVGNWPGVTVERKSGLYKKLGEEIEIIDLPGVYSLSPYSPEEEVANNFLRNDKPDVIINIIDATNIERNLYLTTQLLEMGAPVVVALNMMDEVEKAGDKIDAAKLSASIGVPVVPITAVRGKNIEALMQAAMRAVKQGAAHPLLDEELVKEANAQGDAFEKEAALADLRYRHIATIVSGSVIKAARKSSMTRSDKIDSVLTHRIFAIPVFILIMLLIFQLTFGEPLIPGWENGPSSPGVWLQGVMEEGVGWVGERLEGGLEAMNAAPWAHSIVMDGLVGGVGAVLSFLPQILLLFLFLTLLEDSGYMARAAFIMDRVLRKFGLSGKAFVPMLMGFGCSVPAVMATRTLESEQDRRLTIMLTPFMSCGAKLPIYAVMAGALFAGNAGLVIASMYFLGIIVAVLSGILLKKFVVKGQASPFIMEMPQYRLPTLKNLLRHLWEKGKSYVARAGTIILLSTVVIAFLQNFSWTFQLVENAEDSIIGSIGNFIAPIFRPLGFGTWQAAVAVLTGLLAKENVVGTLSVLFGTGEDVEGNSALLGAIAAAFSPVAAYAFMVFNLLAPPCMAAIATIRKEMNSAKWTFGTIGYQLGIAYVIALLVNLVGGLFF